jgi:hypothetical protein
VLCGIAFLTNTRIIFNNASTAEYDNTLNLQCIPQLCQSNLGMNKEKFLKICAHLAHKCQRVSTGPVVKIYVSWRCSISNNHLYTVLIAVHVVWFTITKFEISRNIFSGVCCTPNELIFMELVTSSCPPSTLKPTIVAFFEEIGS